MINMHMFTRQSDNKAYKNLNLVRIKTITYKKRVFRMKRTFYTKFVDFFHFSYGYRERYFRGLFDRGYSSLPRVLQRATRTCRFRLSTLRMSSVHEPITRTRTRKTHSAIMSILSDNWQFQLGR